MTDTLISVIPTTNDAAASSASQLPPSTIESVVVVDDAVAARYCSLLSWSTSTSIIASLSSPTSSIALSASTPISVVNNDVREGMLSMSHVVELVARQPSIVGIRWYNAWQLHSQLRLIGIKASHCSAIVTSVFHHIASMKSTSSTESSSSTSPTSSLEVSVLHGSDNILAASLASLPRSTAMISSLFNECIISTCRQYGYDITSCPSPLSPPLTLSLHANDHVNVNTTTNVPVKTPTGGNTNNNRDNHNSNMNSTMIDGHHWSLARSIVEHRRSYIILLAGTSGTGKSTLASLLADRLRVSTVISTDSIRHMLRHCSNVNEHASLFMSTYQAADTITMEGISHAKRVRMGYKHQCALITAQLDHMINVWSREHTSVIVEGVHLSLPWMLKAMKRHTNVVIMPFLVYISNAVKHRERYSTSSSNYHLQHASIPCPNHVNVRV
jgi:nicotinamide riboside kinase